VQKDTAAKISAAVKQLLLKTTQTLEETFERGLPRLLEKEYSGNFDFGGALFQH